MNKVLKDFLVTKGKTAKGKVEEVNEYNRCSHLYDDDDYSCDDETDANIMKSLQVPMRKMWRDTAMKTSMMPLMATLKRIGISTEI